uniref:Putative secreted protein n=1 Tax=Rhipicephalus microplus TaxID=6941 RepID=A0A6M2DC19_RHIMP
MKVQCLLFCFFSILLTSCMQDVLITPRGIEAAIDRLSANSAPGPDEICPKMLKTVKLKLCPLLSAIF